MNLGDINSPRVPNENSDSTNLPDSKIEKKKTTNSPPGINSLDITEVIDDEEPPTQLPGKTVVTSPSSFSDETQRVAQAAKKVLPILDGDSREITAAKGIKIDQFKRLFKNEFSDYTLVSSATRELANKKMKEEESDPQRVLQEKIALIDDKTLKFKKAYLNYAKLYESLSDADRKEFNNNFNYYELLFLSKVPTKYEQDPKFGTIVIALNKAIELNKDVNQTVESSRELVFPLLDGQFNQISTEIKKTFNLDDTFKAKEQNPNVLDEQLKGKAYTLAQEAMSCLSTYRHRIQSVKGDISKYTTKIDQIDKNMDAIKGFSHDFQLTEITTQKTEAVSQDAISTNPAPAQDVDQENAIIPANPSLHLNTRDQDIRFSYKYGNEVYGEDHVQRIDTVDALKSILKARIEAIEKKIQTLSLRDAAKLELQKSFCESLLENATRNKNPGWITSNDYRDTLRNESFGESYTDRATKATLGAPVNMRFQEAIAKTGESSGFFRLGVITDLRNGFVSLGELRQLAAKENERFREEKVQDLRNFKMQLAKDPEHNKEKIESLDYALMDLNPGYIEQAIMEREEILSLQMLQLIDNQISKFSDKLERKPAQTDFEMVHLGLLNYKSNRLDSTGWAHYETNEIRDMYQIFADFEGKKVICDGTGPYIDVEGTIHLKADLKDESGKPRELNLKPKFVNVSVQGHTKNDGLQQKINNDELIGFKSLLEVAYKRAEEHAKEPTHDFEEGCQLLKHVHDEDLAMKQVDQLENIVGESNYYTAENIALALMKLDIPFSVGCLSAKDRTGLVCGRAVARYVGDKISEMNPNKERIARKFGSQVLDSKGCAARVVRDNTGISVLKVRPFHLPGFEGLLNKISRLWYYFKQLSTIEFKAIFKSLGHKIKRIFIKPRVIS